MKLQKLISLVGLLTFTTGRYRVPCFFNSKDCGVHTGWIVLQIIIILNYLVSSLDFELLGVPIRSITCFEQKAVGSLVVPFWPSSSFWPLVSRIYANFIVACRGFFW